MVVVVALIAQQQPPPTQPSTRPPENNDEVLRPLTPEEIPPNLNFYAMDPLYKWGRPSAGRLSAFARRSIAA